MTRLRVGTITPAAAYGAAAGVVQALVLQAYLRSTRPDTAPGEVDRGFGQNPDLRVELGWLALLLFVSVLLVGVALRRLRLRWPVLLTPVVLAVEAAVGGVVAVAVGGHGDGRAWLLVPVLALLLAGIAALAPSRRRGS